MEPVNTNDENSFDPTPKLKSSPIPILFLPFDNNYSKCFHCGDEYTCTLFFDQKYCKKCLSRYITEINDNTKYLDMCIYTKNLECSEHETSRDKELLIQNIQEWCKNCSGVSYFKQILARSYNYNSRSSHDDNEKDIINKMFESEKDCKLCGKLVYQQNNTRFSFKMCSNCYQISSGWVESTLTKNPIPILYLPWWDNHDNCLVCSQKLKYIHQKPALSIQSDCQKWCLRCFIIYTGCRYCLTTNVIFGFTNQSQCKKCGRTNHITSISGNSNLDDFLYDQRLNFYNNLQLDETISKKFDNQTEIYDIMRQKYDKIQPEPMMEWIPYSQITNMKQIAEGGFGIIYQATWLDGYDKYFNRRRTNEHVIIKRFKNSQDISKYFLNEVRFTFDFLNTFYLYH